MDFLSIGIAQKKQGPGMTGAFLMRLLNYLAVNEPKGNSDNNKERNLLNDDKFAISH